MKIIIKDQPETRTITRFLIFPRRIGNEIRWLERVKILQSAVRLEGGWIDLSFIDE